MIYPEIHLPIAELRESQLECKERIVRMQFLPASSFCNLAKILITVNKSIVFRCTQNAVRDIESHFRYDQ
jgi:hypothetical protein